MTAVECNVDYVAAGVLHQGTVYMCPRFPNFCMCVCVCLWVSWLTFGLRCGILCLCNMSGLVCRCTATTNYNRTPVTRVNVERTALTHYLKPAVIVSLSYLSVYSLAFRSGFVQLTVPSSSSLFLRLIFHPRNLRCSKILIIWMHSIWLLTYNLRNIYWNKQKKSPCLLIAAKIQCLLLCNLS